MVNPGAVWTFGALLDVAVTVPPFVLGPPTTASRTKPLLPPVKLARTSGGSSTSESKVTVKPF